MCIDALITPVLTCAECRTADCCNGHLAWNQVDSGSKSDPASTTEKWGLEAGLFKVFTSKVGADWSLIDAACCRRLTQSCELSVDERPARDQTGCLFEVGSTSIATQTKDAKMSGKCLL